MGNFEDRPRAETVAGFSLPNYRQTVHRWASDRPVAPEPEEVVHNMAGRCNFMTETNKVAKTIQTRGFCNYADRAGDQVFEEFATDGPVTPAARSSSRESGSEAPVSSRA